LRRLVLAALAVAVLAVAGPAAAATYTMQVGEKGFPPEGVPESTTLNDFFPRVLNIHAGDRVKFRNLGFHTATVLGNVDPATLGFFMPDPAGGTYDTDPDAAGQPFFFEGLAKFVYNVAVATPSKSSVVRNKNSFVNSGFALLPSEGENPDDPPVPGTYTMTFQRTGTYTVVCLIHAGMERKIVVKPRRAKIPSRAAVNARINRQIDAAYEGAIEHSQATPPANTVYAGIGEDATLLAFLPQSITVPAGTTVDFVSMSPGEPHNVVFGPMDWLEPFFLADDLFPAGPGDPNQAHPFFIYGSDAPGADGVYTYSGATQHGNGVFSTPLTDGDPGVPTLGSTARVKFTVPGTYDYFCLLHGPFMSGQVTVTP
jgi:plastocyanin